MIVLYDHHTETFTGPTLGDAKVSAYDAAAKLAADGWEWTGAKASPAKATVQISLRRRVQE